MRPGGVEVLLPFGDDVSGMAEAEEQAFVQEFIASGR